MTASATLIVTWNPDKGKWGERGDTRTPSNGLRGVSPQRWWTGPPATDAVEFLRGTGCFCYCRERRAGESSRAEQQWAKS